MVTANAGEGAGTHRRTRSHSHQRECRRSAMHTDDALLLLLCGQCLVSQPTPRQSVWVAYALPLVGWFPLFPK